MHRSHHYIDRMIEFQNQVVLITHGLIFDLSFWSFVGTQTENPEVLLKTSASTGAVTAGNEEVRRCSTREAERTQGDRQGCCTYS